MSAKNSFILVYGDAFVDYIADDDTNISFTTFLGGATVNVAAGISRIGAPAAFITITGEDETSSFVRQAIEQEGVNMDYAIFHPQKRVSGVYVHLTADGERMFYKYVDETPDLQVEVPQLRDEAFERATVFHICSGTMFHPTALATTRAAVNLAKKHHTLISMDANIRPLRWQSEAHCREVIMSFLNDVDILKCTDDELYFLTEAASLQEGLAVLATHNIPIVLITVGAEGAYALFDGEIIHVPVEKVEPIDTTGAGDAFMAGILRYVHVYGLPSNVDSLVQAVRFGNKLGALASTKPGALTAMPHYDEIEDLL